MASDEPRVFLGNLRPLSAESIAYLASLGIEQTDKVVTLVARGVAVQWGQPDGFTREPPNGRQATKITLRPVDAVIPVIEVVPCEDDRGAKVRGSVTRLRGANPKPRPVDPTPINPRPPASPNGVKGPPPNEELARQLVVYAPKTPDSKIASLTNVPVERVAEMRGAK